ncbi:MAG: DUF6671 family protein [Bacteroidota bacterium]|jgi:hypothetical protein
MFENRKLLIVTKHKKEEVLQPIFSKALKVQCKVSDFIDTDLLGTFSGEKERELGPLETARKKCLIGLEKSDFDLAVSSEGSFGPHPQIPFVSADDEILFFYDKKNNIEIWTRDISTKTNFNSDKFNDYKKLKEFAKMVQFPSHAIILKARDNEKIIKGITNWKALEDSFLIIKSKNEFVFAETDMRAMYNPSRMEVIKQCAEKLIQKILSICPDCKFPGYSITDYVRGLPCEVCNSPTRSVLKHILVCKKCNHTEQINYPENQKFEDPMYCDYCNP